MSPLEAARKQIRALVLAHLLPPSAGSGTWKIDADLLSDDIVSALGLREEWRVEWDGEPKMGGGSHTMASGAWGSKEEAERVVKNAVSAKPNVRIVYRIASGWKQ